MKNWPNTAMSNAEIEAARVLLNSTGLDIASSSVFWELIVARILEGRVTDHRCPWDVEFEAPGCGCTVTVEVKHATEMSVLFRSGRRNVFKFAAPRGARQKAKDADVYVFLGSGKAGVAMWVIPAGVLRKVASITLTVPDERTHTNSRSYPMDRYAVPFDQIIPAVMAASSCHLAYDARIHRANRIASAAGDTLDLFRVGGLYE